MILNLSKLRVSDNSGVKLVKCFKIFNQKTGSIGSIIYVSIKDIKNKSKLKKGDIIMAHDYSPNSEYFEENINNKIWNWHEIKDTDIEDTVNECNLKPFMQEDFQKVVWVCKIKE